jgi:hypothetical protein
MYHLYMMNKKVENKMTDNAKEGYVVIINRGRGQQTTWPSGSAPELYTHAEAQAIVDKERARQNALNGGWQGHAHWHAQPLEDFKNFVSPGNECYYSLQEMLLEF